MHVYLMRHGIATEPSEWHGTDSTRPLTSQGKIQARAMVEYLKQEKNLKLDAVWSSPYFRARQTAEIVAEVLGLEYSEREELSCGCSMELMRLVMVSERPPERIMLVGHEPDMGYMMSALCQGELNAFEKAAVGYLEGTFKSGGMNRVWYLKPR